MERVTKILLMICTIVLVAFASNVQGRRLKEEQVGVEHPHNYLGGFGTSGGLIPTPGGGVGFALGPSVFCAFPGTGCVRLQPTIPGGTNIGTGRGTSPSTGTGTPP